MNDVWVAAGGTRGGSLGMIATGVANELEAVRVQGKGKKAVRTKGLPAAFLTDGDRGGTTTIMKNQGLMVFFEIIRDGGE